jgi:hypothetical protein
LPHLLQFRSHGFLDVQVDVELKAAKKISPFATADAGNELMAGNDIAPLDAGPMGTLRLYKKAALRPAIYWITGRLRCPLWVISRHWKINVC